MNDQSTEVQKKSRLRWITLGEAVAIAALIVSAGGLWLTWKTSERDQSPMEIVEKRSSVPLVLRGQTEDNGKALEITPVESSHSLQSLEIAAVGKVIEVGSSGRLDAKDFDGLIGKYRRSAEGRQRATVRITAHYIEAGTDKTAVRNYTISYRWEGGGLLGGKSLRLLGLTR